MEHSIDTMVRNIAAYIKLFRAACTPRIDREAELILDSVRASLLRDMSIDELFIAQKIIEVSH